MSDYDGPLAGEIADISEPPSEWPCYAPGCMQAVYDTSAGWWCPEHGDQP